MRHDALTRNPERNLTNLPSQLPSFLHSKKLVPVAEDLLLLRFDLIGSNLSCSPACLPDALRALAMSKGHLHLAHAAFKGADCQTG
jgi:hypothetical protein